MDMDLLVKFIIYMVIVSSTVDFALGKPISYKSGKIYYGFDLQTSGKDLEISALDKIHKRQVVQPTWLTNFDNTNRLLDEKVKITEKSLKEAAAIRQTIQEAVNEGKYAVEMTNRSAHGPPLSFDTTPQNAQWNFRWPINTPNEQPNSFMEDMQRAWQNVLDKYRQMLGIN
ncbi:uncharacterized protein LOC119669626 [Teleopsis dalmanni]|uniref:uncharacterized protein LOC119669626 n=1 Tax=Teleopsis dalmanni TaxID=139649 RepID=UPI0018CD8C3A|nr:uncharacterized protein LOC119669626 [Teleopsis dalmanni]